MGQASSSCFFLSWIYFFPSNKVTLIDVRQSLSLKLFWVSKYSVKNLKPGTHLFRAYNKRPSTLCHRVFDKRPHAVLWTKEDIKTQKQLRSFEKWLIPGGRIRAGRRGPTTQRLFPEGFQNLGHARCIQSFSQFCSRSRNANAKDFNYRGATSVSSVFPGARVCGWTAALHAEASDVTVLLPLTSHPSVRPLVRQVTVSICAIVMASAFTPGRLVGLV